MRICYIGDGDSVHNHFMVDWFTERGHDVLFLTDTAENAPACEVIAVAPRRGWSLWRHISASLHVRKAVRKWKPDIVHAHNITGYGYWGAVSGFSPLVMTSWGTDLNILAQKNAMMRFLVGYSLKKAAFITADAEALCQTARELVGAQADIRYLQWGVDLPAFDLAPDSMLRDRFRGHAEVVFLSTRRMRPLYNIDTILHAYQQVLPHFPQSRLVLVGEDSQREALQKLSAELGLESHVTFPGWVSRSELIAAMLCADVYLSVPSSDSTALSLLEAFAARLPVIVSDLPANHEWIEEDVNGLFVNPGDAESLAQAMIHVARDLNQAKRWGERNRSMVEKRGDRHVEMLRLESWYENVIESATDRL